MYKKYFVNSLYIIKMGDSGNGVSCIELDDLFEFVKASSVVS